MSRDPFLLALDEPITETVTAVLTPIDGFTRRRVRTGVAASLHDLATGIPLAGRIVRNRSGSLVLVGLPRAARYRFRLDPTAARYRGPVEVSFTPATDGVEQIVRLEPLATFPFDANTTLIRGMVAQGRRPDGTNRPLPAPGVAVTAEVGSPGRTTSWATTTDPLGGFALPLRLPVDPGVPPLPEPVSLRFDDGVRFVAISRDVTEGRIHTFADVIDLAPGAAQPLFLSVE